MYHSGITFKQFLEEMDPSPEKQRETDQPNKESEKEDYFNALEDEGGLDWSDIIATFEAEPWVSTHFDLGEKLYKRSAWKIVPGTLSKHGADIMLMPQKHDKSYLKGNISNKGEPDKKRYHLNRKELMDFLTKGWSPAVQAAAGGAGGGMM